MGETVSKMSKNNCVKQDEYATVPRYQFKCRFHESDGECETNVYTRTTDIYRYPVPRNKIKWNVDYTSYDPLEFTSAKIMLNDGKIYKDPHILDAQFVNIQFNNMDKFYDTDRQSHHGLYLFAQFSPKIKLLAPVNPVGRTGLIGRGHLGRWGPNHAADPIVTRWKRDSHGKKVLDPNSYKPILEFVAIQRRDTKQWAIPGGMRDPGEVITKTLIREFSEEALNRELIFDKSGRVVDKEIFEKRLEKFFKTGIQIYKGYVDDPRNTDNAWMETIACNFHDEPGNLVGAFKLQGGDDATHAIWLELSSDLQLFASHVDFLREVANMHQANW